jgi:hypothetical protein
MEVQICLIFCQARTPLSTLSLAISAIRERGRPDWGCRPVLGGANDTAVKASTIPRRGGWRNNRLRGYFRSFAKQNSTPNAATSVLRPGFLAETTLLGICERDFNRVYGG